MLTMRTGCSAAPELAAGLKQPMGGFLKKACKGVGCCTLVRVCITGVCVRVCVRVCVCVRVVQRRPHRACVDADS